MRHRHRRRRLGPVVVAVAALVVFGAAGCEPQMEIHVSLHRSGTISAPEGNGFRTLVLTGVSQCTRSEPVDLFPTLRQGTVADRPGETSVPCGPHRQEWSASFMVIDDFGPGDMRVDIEACTNPAEPIDEDCASLGRIVTLAELT